MDYSRFLNNVSKNRQANSVQIIPKLYEMAPKGTIFMAGGMPNSLTFPFSKVTVETIDGQIIIIEGEKLSKSLQYQPTAGYSPLVDKLKQLQNKVHNLSDNYWDKNDLIVTCGSLDGICKTFEMILNQNDPVITQEPLYPSVILAALPFEPNFITIEQNEFGISPIQLRNTLQKLGTIQEFHAKKPGLPKVIYLNPTSSNPCGTTIPEHRRREIYKIACEYDLIIMEDDPYYFITFEDKLPSSFLSIDTEGRVLRYDSFSKILSAGIRIGYMTGPKVLLDKIMLHMQVTMMHASSLSMVIVDELLAAWGFEKLYQYFNKVKEFYFRQRNAAIYAAKKHLTGLAEWNIPNGGMFLWLKFPKYKDMKPFVGFTGLKYGTIIAGGHNFKADSSKNCQYVRVSYSLTSQSEMEEGFFRLAQFLKHQE